jgi:hypothetical protein
MCDVKGGCTCGNEYCADDDSVLEDYIFPSRVDGKTTLVENLPNGSNLPELIVVETKVLLPAATE